jgi:prepilin-type N-terminal cleavage/methylation domain-containing protein
MSKSNKTQRGFSLVEALVATIILSVGLLAAASLMTRTFTTSMESKDTSIATMLCSEKLEDLARYPSADAHVNAGGGVVGDLNNDIVQNVTVGLVTSTINYYDDVFINTGTGTLSETRTGLDPVTGSPNFTQTDVAADGTVTTTVTAGSPPGQPTFKRRWMIEDNQPINGLKRITVRVTAMTGTRPATFQMTMVRP